MDKTTERLFIGLWPAPSVQKALAAYRDAYSWPRSAALVATPKLHLTLHFLGDVAVEAIAPLRAALALPFSPFELRLGLPVSWHSGIAVLEPFETPPALLALHQQLAEVLDALGLPRDARAYKPHVTMARRAVGAAPPQPLSLDWSVRDFSLMASRGGVYDTLQYYPATA
ncbi:MAG: RNA 2',3'-cyclic phosphodiesterase [Massilia sp.]